MLSRDSEDEIWSRFVFELVIWPQEVTLVRWTQSSGPSCLWQCLIITWTRFECEYSSKLWFWMIPVLLFTKSERSSPAKGKDWHSRRSGHAEKSRRWKFKTVEHSPPVRRNTCKLLLFCPYEDRIRKSWLINTLSLRVTILEILTPGGKLSGFSQTWSNRFRGIQHFCLISNFREKK